MIILNDLTFGSKISPISYVKDIRIMRLPKNTPKSFIIFESSLTSLLLF